MLRCSTENVLGDLNFEKPFLISEGEKYSDFEGGNIVKKETDIRILVYCRRIVVVRKRVEAR